MKVYAAIAAAFAPAFLILALAFGGSNVYHMAEIEHASGHISRVPVASESACLAFTRALGADVARADCYTESR